MLGLGSFRANAQERRPQRVHRADFAPSSDEVFSVALQFYEYDRGLPLAPRTVEAWEEDAVAVYSFPNHPARHPHG